MNTSNKLYVENLAAATTADGVIKLFSIYGKVTSVYIAVDRTDQKVRGFGFVTMVTPEGANAAIQSLHGKPVGAHALTVREASPHEISGVGRNHNMPKTKTAPPGKKT